MVVAMAHPNRERGSALITALLITSIAAMLATSILFSLHLFIQQTTETQVNDQLYEYVLGVNEWAKTIVLQTKTLKNIPSLQKKIGETTIYGTITTEDGLFNLNSLGAPNNIQRFIRLLRVLIPNLSADKATALAGAISNWVSPINSTSDDRYYRQEPPYRPAHRWMVSKSELRAVLGIDAKTYHILAPYVTTLPQANFAIDVNSAPALLFITLQDSLTMDMATALADCRNRSGHFANVQDFLDTCGKNIKLSSDGLITDSHYFLVHGKAIQQDQQLLLTSLLFTYQDVHHQQQVKLIWQELNTDP